jgi:hypothetical protein
VEHGLPELEQLPPPLLPPLLLPQMLPPPSGEGKHTPVQHSSEAAQVLPPLLQVPPSACWPGGAATQLPLALHEKLQHVSSRPHEASFG